MNVTWRKKNFLTINFEMDKKLFDTVISLYEQAKYTAIDVAFRPNHDELVSEFKDDLFDTLEEILEENSSANVADLGYYDEDSEINRFIKFIFTNHKSGEFEYDVNITKVGSFTEMK